MGVDNGASEKRYTIGGPGIPDRAAFIASRGMASEHVVGELDIVEMDDLALEGLFRTKIGTLPGDRLYRDGAIREQKAKAGYKAVLELVDFIETNATPAELMEIVPDFFASNPPANLWALVKFIGRAAVLSASGSRKSESTRSPRRRRHNQTRSDRVRRRASRGRAVHEAASRAPLFEKAVLSYIGVRLPWDAPAPKTIPQDGGVGEACRGELLDQCSKSIKARCRPLVEPVAGRNPSDLFLAIASPAGAALCTLSWDANTEADLVGYYAFARLDGGYFPSQAQWIGNVTTTTCEALGATTPGARYWFMVKAYNASGNKRSLDEVSFDVPAAPLPPPPPPPPPRTCLKYAGKSGSCKQWSQ